MSRHVCPRCGGSLDQVHRRRLDRLISRAWRIHRYRCRTENCGWEGVQRSLRPGGSRNPRRMRPWIWAAVFLVSVLAATVMIAYLDSRPGSTSVESAPTP